MVALKATMEEKVLAEYLYSWIHFLIYINYISLHVQKSPLRNPARNLRFREYQFSVALAVWVAGSDEIKSPSQRSVPEQESGGRREGLLTDRCCFTQPHGLE